MKSLHITCIALTSIVLLSCNRDERDNSALTESKISHQIDAIAQDVSTIIDDQYQLQSSVSGKMTEAAATTVLPTCALIDITALGNMWTRTIHFTNCTLPNGNVLNGTLVISGSNDFEAPIQTLNYSFVDFFHNDIQVTGNRTVVRTMESTAILATVHPVAEIDFNMTLLFPNGQIYQRVGSRTREMIEGFTTPLNFSDNVYSITGDWITTFPTGTRNATITTPLVAKASCAHIVSGVISISSSNYSGDIDYGDGQCDNQAELTINGTTFSITLGP